MSIVVNDDINIMRMLKSKDRNIFRFLEISLSSEIHVNAGSVPAIYGSSMSPAVDYSGVSRVV